MKLIKVFLKDCIKNYWFWITVALTFITILDSYSNSSDKFPYMTQILILLSITCCISTCYKLYYRIACKYPDILISDNKDLKFEDVCPFFQFNKSSTKFHPRYKINCIEDDKNFIIGDYYGSSVTLKLFNKIYIKKVTNKTIELSKPTISLSCVNNIADNFFINRLQVSLDSKKNRFSKQRYFDYHDYTPSKEPWFYKFPYCINSKESVCIFLYLEIELNSSDEESFNELLDWIRSVEMEINIPFTKDGEEISNKYNMKYNFKKDFIKQMICEKVKSEEEFEKYLEDLSHSH